MATRLEIYERRYRALTAELAEIGFISPGSLVVRTTSCGKPNCGCQADPAPTPRPLLPMEPRGRRQDRKPTA